MIFVGITLSQKEIRRTKPSYLGAAILDLSKLHLYRFHYEEMTPLFDKKSRVMYRDTDSLFYEIETDDTYEDLVQLQHVLNLIDYPKDHHLHSELNKKVPLKLSDELNGDNVMKAVFLKPKAYSLKSLQKVKQSTKGVSKHVKKTLHHTNLYTLTHFLADFTQTCSIMRADEKFLAIIPCMLGLLPENVKDLPLVHFERSRFIS